MDNEIYEKMVENLKNHPERFGRQHYFKIEDGKIHEYSIISVMPYHCVTRLKWHLMDSSGIVEDDISIDEYCKSVFLRRDDAEAELERIMNDRKRT